MASNGSTPEGGARAAPPLAWLALSLVVLACDQASKAWASASLVLHRPRPLLPFLDLTLMHNRGAAFSFLHAAGGWQRWLFTALALLVAAAILWWLWRLPRNERLTACALSLVLGGALGNAWDRMRLGYVVDFIDVHYGDWHWPAFNVADSAITVGAALLIVDGLRRHPAHDKGES